MLSIFEGLFNFKSVVVDTDNLRATTRQVVGEDIPRLGSAPAPRRANDAERHSEHPHARIVFAQVLDPGDLVVTPDVVATFEPDVKRRTFGA